MFIGESLFYNICLISMKRMDGATKTTTTTLLISKYKLGQFAPQIAEKLVEAGQDKYTSDSNTYQLKQALQIAKLNKYNTRQIHEQLK